MKRNSRAVAVATLTSLWLVVAVAHGGPTAASDPTSCKAIKSTNPSAPSGIYTIDPDGDGALVPVMVNCEMVIDGGGWTLGVKSWYQGGVYGNTGAVGTVGDGLTHKGNPYKLSDDIIRAFIGPSQNFDVMADQSGYNSSYSTGNYERVILRNYTGFWRFDAPVAASTTPTVMQSYRTSDDALAWTGELGCGSGGAGINCSTVISNNPQGGAGCGINMGSATSPGWHLFFMSETNSDTYLYICNGAQHSSDHDMNHRWWFRERAGPTAVSLRTFSASRAVSGRWLRWRTAEEASLLGFNLYRQQRGNLVKLNRALIPSVFGGMASGLVYSFLDRSARRGATYTYRLQTVKLDGTRTWLGTVIAKP